jgi:hypothetical protein
MHCVPDLWGRKPKLSESALNSSIGVELSKIIFCNTFSLIVKIPRGLNPGLLFLGTHTRLTGLAM